MTQQPLRLVIAGGGTGGHVLPAVAVLEELRQRGLTVDAHWIGSTTGVERDAAAGMHIPFHPIPTGKLRRYLSARAPADLARIPWGVIRARQLLQGLRPQVVFSTGGFVSVPTVIAAKGLAPVLTHEQTAILGLANRINARFADLLAVSYETTAQCARKRHRRVVVTGNPVRASLATGDVARGLAHWHFSSELPLLYVTGGARGASPLNALVAALLPSLLEYCQVLHQTGPASANDDATQLRRQSETWPPHLRRRYQVVDFVRDELPDVYAAASLVLSRSGAGTVAELASLGKPAVLIPLPGAGGDEQTRNARLLAEAGGAILLPQSEATIARLRATLLDLLATPSRLQEMADGARTVGHRDAARSLADQLLSLADATPRP